MKEALIIPAQDPEPSLLKLIFELEEKGFKNIVIVDDGSSQGKEGIFDEASELGCIVLHHRTNIGKGESIKSGISEVIKLWGRIGVITLDADGQHCPEDIVKVARQMETSPEALILGVRDFSGKNVPLRSKAGNIITFMVFKIMTGKTCPDTQTGLRGIPASLLSLALNEEGSRYEYEMNFLMDAVRLVPVRMVPIETIYEDKNRSSHFRPVRDSLMIYGRPLKFLLSSLAGALTDYLAFGILLLTLGFSSLGQALSIIIATIAARLISGTMNFELNRRWSFRSRNSDAGDLSRYLVLFFSLMATSAAGTSMLSNFISPALSKPIIDTVLFFLSYRVQQNWVFSKKDIKAKSDSKAGKRKFFPNEKALN